MEREEGWGELEHLDWGGEGAQLEKWAIELEVGRTGKRHGDR